MKLPRHIGGRDLIDLLTKFGYEVVRQTGSHVRLKSEATGKAHFITIPLHRPLKVGTLNNILSDIAEYLKISKKELIEKLFR
ncbi:MAG: type II toxin-antitoxin system HicA family toxin [Thermoplasmata archaeon]|nr:MAG: type II toxin-antitoxin system HicA family toxin [Thermoplasmata archaeon]